VHCKHGNIGYSWSECMSAWSTIEVREITLTEADNPDSARYNH
jgi:hypothetical protein